MRGGGRFPMRGLIVSAAVFAILIVMFLLAFSEVGRRSATEEAALLKQAVRRAVVACYAIEGRYPSNAGYLTENYALRYDERRYIVSLDSFASNVCPQIRVLERGVAVK